MQDTLRHANELLKEGKRKDAHQLLVTYLKTDPNSAQAWWLLSQTIADKEKQADCLKRVLLLEPNFAPAHKRLAFLENAPQHPATPQKKAPAKKKISGLTIGLILFVFGLGIIGIGYFGSVIIKATNPDSMPAPAQIAFSTETQKPAQSLPPTWTPTPSSTVVTLPTMTPYETPNSTNPSNLDSPIVFPTNSSDFKPGDPTATPLGTDITDPNFIEGKKAYDAGNYAEAIALISAVIETNPNLAPPYRYRGTAYWALDDCLLGLEDHEKALSINPDYAASWAGRGLAHSCLGNAEQELEDYKKALSLDPSLAFVHHNMGVYYFNRGDYQKSLEEYSTTLDIDPTRINSMAAKGEVLTKLGRHSECVSITTRVININ